MPRHKFTREDSQKGGWSRARQHAEERRASPTPTEAQVRKLLVQLGWEIFPEYEIATDLFPQWIDILAIKDGRKVAIEVDGSHGWHNFNAYHTKMAIYDETKARWCFDQGIQLVYVPKKGANKEFLEEQLEKERING